MSYNHIDACMDYVRACGPTGRAGFAAEIRTQAENGTAENCYQLADAAIQHGLSTGWLAPYDEMPDAYVFRSNPPQR